MNFQSYLEKHGDEYCAELFNVKPRTVASWRRRERYPRVDQAQQIVAVTDGAVSMDDIFGTPEDEFAA